MLALNADAAINPLEDITLAAVGVAVNAVKTEEAEDVKADAATNPPEDKALATLGALVKAVNADDAEAVNAEAAINAGLIPLAVANTGADVGGALKAVIAAEAEDVCADTASQLPDESKAETGAAVKAVKAELAVAKVEAAANEAVVRLVTAEAVNDEAAFAP